MLSSGRQSQCISAYLFNSLIKQSIDQSDESSISCAYYDIAYSFNLSNHELHIYTIIHYKLCKFLYIFLIKTPHLTYRALIFVLRYKLLNYHLCSKTWRLTSNFCGAQHALIERERRQIDRNCLGEWERSIITNKLDWNIELITLKRVLQLFCRKFKSLLQLKEFILCICT